MAGLDQHLKDPEYANWVKNSLCLKFTLDVLKLCVYQELPAIQKSVTERGQPGVVCSSCNVSKAPDCPNNVCNVYLKEIEDYHRHANPSFRITNAKKWKTDVREIAKCFMPPFERYKYSTPSDADFSGVISVIVNCKHFDALVSCDLKQDRNVFCEAKTMSNVLIHSDSLKISEADFQENLDLLIRLLSCFKERTSNITEAIEQIKKVKTGEYQITLDDVLYARKQADFANCEEFKGEERIKQRVDFLIGMLRHEIETASPIWKAPQHRLIGNFIKGCKYSLIKLVKSKSESGRPERYPRHQWNFEKFLSKIELYPAVGALPNTYKGLMYPEDGSPSDIQKWDIFLLCHILCLETVLELPNSLKTYLRSLEDTRDKILNDPNSIGEEDLEKLTFCLDEPLRTELKEIFACEDITEDAIQLQSRLICWKENGDNMDLKQISIKALEQTKKEAKRIHELEKTVLNLINMVETPANQKKIDKLRQNLSRSASSEDGKGNIIEKKNFKVFLLCSYISNL